MINIKNIVLGIIIAVMFLLFAVYGTKLIYEAPEYEDYCNSSRYAYPTAFEKIGSVNCTYNQTLQNSKQDCYNQKGEAIPIYDENGCEKSFTCDFCMRDFEKAQGKYSQNLFLIGIILILVTVVISALKIKAESVSAGLMAGSLMFLIYISATFWRFMEDWFRFIVLTLALGVIIFVGYKLGKKKQRR